MARGLTPEGGADRDGADNRVALIVPTYILMTTSLTCAHTHGRTYTRTHLHTQTSKCLICGHGPLLLSHSCPLISTSLRPELHCSSSWEGCRDRERVCLYAYSVYGETGRCVHTWQNYGGRKCGSVETVRVQRAADRHWQERRWERGWQVKLQRMCGFATEASQMFYTSVSLPHFSCSSALILLYCSGVCSVKALCSTQHSSCCRALSAFSHSAHLLLLMCPRLFFSIHLRLKGWT